MEQTQPSLNGQNATGILLVHGLNGQKGDMAEIEEMLIRLGFTTVNMLLPGHGTQVQDMYNIGWPEWAEAVREQTRSLLKRCQRVFLVGHSLGGALCLHIASQEKVAGLVTLCAPAFMPPWMLPAVRLTRRFTQVLPTLREDIRDPRARSRYARLVYGWTPMAPVENMLQYLPRLRAELPSVTVPILIIRARQDHVVPARDGQAIYDLVGSQDKELVTLHRSYHVVMKDYDHAEVQARTLAFIQNH